MEGDLTKFCACDLVHCAVSRRRPGQLNGSEASQERPRSVQLGSGRARSAWLGLARGGAANRSRLFKSLLAEPSGAVRTECSRDSAEGCSQQTTGGEIFQSAQSIVPILFL